MSIFLTFPTPHIMVFPPRVERPGPIGPRQTPWAASVADGMIAAAGDWHRSRFSVNCDKIESLSSTESEGRQARRAATGHYPVGVFERALTKPGSKFLRSATRPEHAK